MTEDCSTLTRRCLLDFFVESVDRDVNGNFGFRETSCITGAEPVEQLLDAGSASLHESAQLFDGHWFLVAAEDVSVSIDYGSYAFFGKLRVSQAKSVSHNVWIGMDREYVDIIEDGTRVRERWLNLRHLLLDAGDIDVRDPGRGHSMYG